MQRIKLMDGLLHRITEGGKFTTYLFKLSDGSYGRIYTGPHYRNYHNWKDLRIGDLVSGLVWYNELKGILDGDSPVHITPIVEYSR
jgi:hypothetical protein